MNRKIATIHPDENGKFSVNLNNSPITYKYLDVTVLKAERNVAQDFANAINSNTDIHKENFSLKAFPFEYQLLCKLNDIDQGMDWLILGGQLWWIISSDNVFRLDWSTFNNNTQFNPVKTILKNLKEEWQYLPKMPIHTSKKELVFFMRDDNFYINKSLYKKIKLLYQNLNNIEKAGLYHLWETSNKNIMLSLSLFFNFCTLDEFSKGVKFLNINTNPSFQINKTINIEIKANQILNWVRRNNI